MKAINRLSRTIKKLQELTCLCSNSKSLLVAIQDNPDPDAIAASSALKELAKEKADLVPFSPKSYKNTPPRQSS